MAAGLDLASVNVNKYYIRDPNKDGTDEEYRQVVELVLICSEAEYVRTNTGDITKNRKLVAHRIAFFRDEWPKLRDHITLLVDADESELG